MIKLLLLPLFFLFPATLFAGTLLGDEVSQYKGKPLKWDAGQRSYFVMFKSLLENQNTVDDVPGNPQADHCVDEATGSTYTLNSTHLPQDATIERAFLVWTGAVRNNDLDGVLDNEVSLKFVSSNGGYSLSKEVEVLPKKLSSFSDFSFESYRFPDDPRQAYFTYRTDITEFFLDIHAEGEKQGVKHSGFQLFGDYTLSNLICAEDEYYVSNSTMVSGWSIILIYRSDEVATSNIYIYNGFSGYFHSQTEVSVTGFKFPENPQIRLTLSSFEGDPNRAVLHDANGNPAFPEGVFVKGAIDDWLPLSNICNPPAKIQDATEELSYIEVFNSYSSQYGFADSYPTCIGGIPPQYNSTMEYGVDMDTFVIDTKKQDNFAGLFYKDGDKIEIKISANQDWILTNFLVVAVSSSDTVFDIPNEPEMFVCSHSPQDQRHWCNENEELWFAVKIQNWGDYPANNITIKDSLDYTLMEYLPGTTSYAMTIDDKWGVAERDWISVPDNGVFPLENGFVLDGLPTMRPCNEDGSWDGISPITPSVCPDTAIVRFKVKLKTLSEIAIVQNIADISMNGMTDSYQTNSGTPLRLVGLYGDGCSRSVDMTLCGGDVLSISCQEDSDCPAGKECKEEVGYCVNIEGAYPTENVIVKVSAGKNPSPTNMDNLVYVHSGDKNVVLGSVLFNQITGKNAFYYLNGMKFGLTSSLVQDSLSNLRVVEDINNNGSLDDSDIEFAQCRYYSTIIMFQPEHAYDVFGGVTHRFFIVADIHPEISGEVDSKKQLFHLSLLDPFSIFISDDGAPIVQLVDGSGKQINRIDFTTFMVLPEDYSLPPRNSSCSATIIDVL